jgi:hypothetical protein
MNRPAQNKSIFINFKNKKIKILTHGKITGDFAAAYAKKI